jgi:hypothetical protein
VWWAEDDCESQSDPGGLEVSGKGTDAYLGVRHGKVAESKGVAVPNAKFPFLSDGVEWAFIDVSPRQQRRIWKLWRETSGIKPTREGPETRGRPRNLTSDDVAVCFSRVTV